MLYKKCLLDNLQRAYITINLHTNKINVITMGYE
jgi:hypothetical protein